MAIVKPFKAWRYGDQAAKQMQNFVVPPYDVITDVERAELQKSDSHNFSHIILAQGENKHKKAAQNISEWKSQGILIREKKAGFYFYRQEFNLSESEKFGLPENIQTVGKSLSRFGFFARVKVEDYSRRVILPHEKTFAKYKQDRYELTQECQGNMEPVFLGYDSSFLNEVEFQKTVHKLPQLYNYKDRYGVIHSLWLATDEELCEKIEAELKEQSLYILDGHHRYETALKYYQDYPSENTQYVLAQVCAFQQKGMVILPTHRLVSGEAEFSEEILRTKVMPEFEFQQMESLRELELKQKDSSQIAFGVALGEKLFLAVLKTKDKLRGALDLDYLHELILTPLRFNGDPKIHYVRNTEEFFSEMKSGKHQFGILVRPNTYEDVVNKSSQGQVMPHKSTFFFPKIPSGLVINSFES